MADRIDTLLELLREAGTGELVREFLRRRELPHSSSSWADLVKLRIRPALARGQITEKHLLDLLREAEEHGRKHTFLYRPKPSTRVPDDAAVHRWLVSHDAADVLVTPHLEQKPAAPTIADVRRDAGALIIKIVETRVTRELVGKEQSATQLVVTYNIESVRAVHVVRLSARGALEIRIESNRSGSRNYREPLNEVWKLISGLIRPTAYTEWSLIKAKRSLLEGRSRFTHLRFSDARVRRDDGRSMTIATGDAAASLFDDASTDATVNSFTEDGASHCDSLNLWWNAQPRGTPSVDIHVLLAGEPHEFAVTQRCTKADYEHVLDAIRTYSR